MNYVKNVIGAKGNPELPLALRNSQPNHQSVTLHLLRAGHHGIVPQGHWEYEVCDSSDPLFHQLGKGQGFGKHPRCCREEIFLEEHRDSVWCAGDTDLR